MAIFNYLNLVRCLTLMHFSKKKTNPISSDLIKYDGTINQYGIFISCSFSTCVFNDTYIQTPSTN